MLQPKFINLYMSIAETVAKTSSAVRMKVGAVAVKDHRILSIGYNGTLPGDSNVCEYTEHFYKGVFVTPKEADCLIGNPKTNQDDITTKLVTRDTVIHAEANCLMKMARDGQSSFGSDMFLTLTPCVECAKLMILGGVRKVWFRDHYRCSDGLDLLSDHNILTEKV